MTTHIRTIHAREILDSRGNPTVEAEVFLEDGAWGRAAVPSGASTGEHEALELRDKDPQRYRGQGVQMALRNIVETIAPALVGTDARDQAAVDHIMISLDGTPHKSRLGANAILAVSLATARAAAQSSGLSLFRYLGGVDACTLPVPFMNLLNGGAHANNHLDIQEFMVVPWGLPNFADALRAGVEIFHQLKILLAAQGKSTAVGDEGGFAPDFHHQEDALHLLVDAIVRAQYTPGEEVALAIDVAASELFDKSSQQYRFEGKPLEASALVDLYEQWAQKYPLISIEDGLAEDDWDGWQKFTQRLGGQLQLIGDDLFVTDRVRLERGIALGCANAILIKVNQIGTLTETWEAISLAQRSGYHTVISHRSGETEDTFIADLAVASSSGQIKTGAASRTDRLCKYNQLVRIADELGDTQRFDGKAAVKNNFLR